MSGAQSKAKGGKFERAIAKRLGTWMFNDEDMLWRESTSGGRKKAYVGDIVPQKAHEFKWNIWPFHFELKSGYGPHTPTLMKQTEVRKWLYKLMSELTEKQYLPVLIAQFLNHTPIMMTTLLLNAPCGLCLMQEYDGKFYQFYIYDFYDTLKQNFYETMPVELVDYINQYRTAVAQPQLQQPRQKQHSKMKIAKSTPCKYAGIEDVLGDFV